MSINIQSLPEELIGEMEREGINWTKALAEVIDNSLDAGALRVVIRVEKAFIRIQDDGHGCEWPGQMLRKGFSTKRGKRGMTGRYGIGLKHASYYVCHLKGDTMIETTSKGKTRAVTANWGKLIAQQTWEIDDAIEVDAPPNTCGTVITFGRGSRRFPTGENLSPVLDELRFIFSPALNKGRQIILYIDGKPLLLEPLDKPTFTESISKTITIGKKTVRLNAGLVSPGQSNKRRGLSLFYAHRNIIANSALGCGAYPIAHISGEVELDEHWKLGQNKTSITDDDLEDLREAIEVAMEPLLRKAKRISDSATSSALQTSLTNCLNQAFMRQTKGQAKRPGTAGKTGTVTPKGTKRKVLCAGVVSGEGEIILRDKNAKPFSVEFSENHDDPLMYRVDLIGRRVSFNTVNTNIKRAEETGNLDHLKSMAVSAVIHAVLASADGTKTLPGIENVDAADRFTVAYSMAMAGLTLVEPCETQRRPKKAK